MIRFIRYTGAWRKASAEGFTFVRGEYLGVPKRIAERLLLNPDFEERLDVAEPTAPVPVPPEPPVELDEEDLVEEEPEEEPTYFPFDLNL